MWEVDGGSESATPAFTFTEGAGGEPQPKEPDEAESTHKSVGHKSGFVKRAHVQLAGQAAELKARLEEHAGNEYVKKAYEENNNEWTQLQSWDNKLAKLLVERDALTRQLWMRRTRRLSS